MAWIRITSPADAQGALARSFSRLGAPHARLDQIMLVHGERPHTLEGHMALYRSVLHHRANTLDSALAEAIGVRVSRINRCRYCVTHHSRGLRRALNDEALADRWLQALETDALDDVFDTGQVLALAYAEALTRTPDQVTEDDTGHLRSAGWTDGEILEINQITAYFAYANRTVLGLGVTTEDESHP